MARAAAAAALVALALVPATAAAPAPAPARAGFDHNLHARDVDLAGRAAIACTACHPQRAGALIGRPGHAACFGACHGAAPAARESPPPERLRVCAACHAEPALAAPSPAALAVGYPPYALDPDFALAIGHSTHRAVACTQCHSAGQRARPGGPPHRRCASCHDGGAGKGSAMTACATCHTPGAGRPDPPQLLRTSKTQIVVTTAFSHARHAARSVTGRTCTTCHAAIAETDDRQLPRPAAAGCAIAGCHDGEPAFAITASCTRCHRDVPATKFEVARPVERFSHATHDQAQLACAACHPLAGSGEVLVAGHAPCAGCHGDDFGSRWPKICGACHNGTEPWRALVADRLPAERSEFGASIDHRKHGAGCASCHALTTATAELRPPRGHRACTGKGCHAVTGGVAPALTACEDCHERNLSQLRASTRLAATWSVRAKFRHAPHARDRAGAAIACTLCHDDLTAPTVLSLAAPGKATCAPCHDGRTAFKLTGTACTRCHPGAR